MLQHMLEIQTEGKTITLGALAKLSGKTVAEVWDELEQGFEGYTIEGLENGATKATQVVLYRLDDEGEESEASEGAVSDDQTTDETAAEADETADETADEADEAPARKTRGAFEAGVYPDYATVEEAAAANPEGYMTVADVHRYCLEHKIPVSRFVKAMGGDKLKFQPRSSFWTPFTIAGGSKRHLSNAVLTDLEAIAQELVDKAAQKAANAAALEQEKAAKKAEREAAKAAKAAAAQEAAAKIASTETTGGEAEKPTRKSRKSKTETAE